MLSTVTPRICRNCRRREHLPLSNVMLSLPPSVRNTSREAALSGRAYSAAARTRAQHLVCNFTDWSASTSALAAYHGLGHVFSAWHHARAGSPVHDSTRVSVKNTHGVFPHGRSAGHALPGTSPWIYGTVASDPSRNTPRALVRCFPQHRRGGPSRRFTNLHCLLHGRRFELIRSSANVETGRTKNVAPRVALPGERPGWFRWRPRVACRQ